MSLCRLTILSRKPGVAQMSKVIYVWLVVRATVSRQFKHTPVIPSQKYLSLFLIPIHKTGLNIFNGATMALKSLAGRRLVAQPS